MCDWSGAFGWLGITQASVVLNAAHLPRDFEFVFALSY
jgi:hypothetical protein